MNHNAKTSLAMALTGILGLTSTATVAEPFYVGLVGGYEDTTADHSQATLAANETTVNGPTIGGILGANIPTSFGYVGFEANVSDSSAEESITERQDNGSFQNETTASGLGYGITTTLGFEITPATHVYGLVGYQQQKIDFEGRDFDAPSATTTDVETDETFGGVRFGIGVNYELYHLVGVRLEISRTDFSDEDVNILGARNVSLEQDRITMGVIGRF